MVPACLPPGPGSPPSDSFGAADFDRAAPTLSKTPSSHPIRRHQWQSREVNTTGALSSLLHLPLCLGRWAVAGKRGLAEKHKSVTNLSLTRTRGRESCGWGQLLVVPRNLFPQLCTDPIIDLFVCHVYEKLRVPSLVLGSWAKLFSKNCTYASGDIIKL